MGRFGVTRLALAPPALLAIVRTAEEANAGAAAHVATLLAVNCGGAPLAADLIARFSRTLPGVGVTQVGFSLLQVHVFWFLVQRIS